VCETRIINSLVAVGNDVSCAAVVYSGEEKINKWYKKLFRSLLSDAVLISLIIHTRNIRWWW